MLGDDGGGGDYDDDDKKRKPQQQSLTLKMGLMQRKVYIHIYLIMLLCYS
jgi:hypothetical protein